MTVRILDIKNKNKRHKIYTGNWRLNNQGLNLLLVGFDVTDLTTVGTPTCRTSFLDRVFCTCCVRRHGTIRALQTDGRQPGSSFLLLALLTTFLVLLETFFFLLDPVV